MTDTETVVVPDMTRTQAEPGLAWSIEPESDVVITTDDATDDTTRSWAQTISAAAALVAGPALLVAGLHSISPTMDTTTVTAAPTRGGLIAVTLPPSVVQGTTLIAAPPPSTVAAPPVTVAPPVTITAPPPIPAAVIPPTPTGPVVHSVDSFLAGIAEAPTVDRMPPNPAALQEGREACTLMDGGQTRTQTDNILAAEHHSAYDFGVAFASADWIFIEARDHLC